MGNLNDICSLKSLRTSILLKYKRGLTGLFLASRLTSLFLFILEQAKPKLSLTSFPAAVENAP